MFLKDEIALYPLSVKHFLLASKQEKSLRLASRKDTHNFKIKLSAHQIAYLLEHIFISSEQLHKE